MLASDQTKVGNMVKYLEGVLDSVVKLGGLASGWLVSIMVVLVFTEAFSRYVFGQPLGVADEFGGYIFVAVSFLGAAYTWKEKGHVRITALVSRLPAKVANPLRLVTLVLVTVSILGLCWSSYNFIIISFKFHVASDTWLHFPMQGPHMVLPIGFALLLLVLFLDIGRAIRNIRAGKNVEESL